MGEQGEMFARPRSGLASQIEGQRDPARNSDPDTSRLAAKHMKRSGKMAAQALECLERLTSYIARTGEDPTSSELALGDAHLIHVQSRRLTELRVAKAVTNTGKRRCKISGRLAMTWRPT